MPVQKSLLEISARRPCSQRRSVTSGDGGARQGQNGRGRVSAQAVGAKLQVVLKHRAVVATSDGRSWRKASRLFSPSPQGGWRRHLFTMATTLTGESPTPFRSSLRTTRTHKSTTKGFRSRGGATVPSLVRSFGDGSFSGVVPSQRDQRRIRGNSDRDDETMRAASPTAPALTSKCSRASLDGVPGAKKHSPRPRHFGSFVFRPWEFSGKGAFLWPRRSKLIR